MTSALRRMVNRTGKRGYERKRKVVWWLVVCVYGDLPGQFYRDRLQKEQTRHR